MQPTTPFIERRKEYRLPYFEKVIYSDGSQSASAYGANISRGGIFVTTLEPFPLDTQVMLAFCLPDQEFSFCLKGKVAHIVFDRQRCEIECGMGFVFEELDEIQRETLNQHILDEQKSYSGLRIVLEKEYPNFSEIESYLHRFPSLKGYDLLRLRYRVNRICTIFENQSSLSGEDTFSGKVANM